MNRYSDLISLGIIALVITALVGITWANYQYALQNPGGNDFIPRWMGTRLFLMEGQSPYSDQTTQEIQDMMYGRSARSDEDQVLFVYPFYSIYLFWPFALIPDFDIARAVWMTVLELSVIAIALISLSLSRWQVKPLMLVGLLVFVSLWYHSVRPLINGNASILIGLMIAAVLLAIRAEQDWLAGFLLALTTVKPQIVILFAIFVLAWAISRRRMLVFWSFVGSLALLIASTSLLISDWTWQNLVQVVAYPTYTLPGTPGAILAAWVPGVGSQVGWALTVFLIVVLIREWWLAMGKDFNWFLWTACLTLVVTNLIGIRTATANYIAMFPALILVLASWDQQWRIFGRGLVIFSMLLLFFGLWWLFIITIEVGDQPLQNPIMFFPLPVSLLMGLYWVRWWVLQPKSPLLDRIRRSVGVDVRN